MKLHIWNLADMQIFDLVHFKNSDAKLYILLA